MITEREAPGGPDLSPGLFPPDRNLYTSHRSSVTVRIVNMQTTQLRAWTTTSRLVALSTAAVNIQDAGVSEQKGVNGSSEQKEVFWVQIKTEPGFKGLKQVSERRGGGWCGGGDKPVTASLQTEAQGAHLKQQDDWPAAIAGQHLRETGETGEAGLGGRRRSASKAWHTFRGGEALGRPIYDRAAGTHPLQNVPRPRSREETGPVHGGFTVS
ncbi:unnamed protein product [Pleuronectes platessa]|uniref:Uncharacterized protein n=1 Tax=Pleuronectes platessa TaxID=8262 RepID=A0A9N7UU50_PLEPL|nr:unnamed protein product [Pleuronectes platessa]